MFLMFSTFRRVLNTECATGTTEDKTVHALVRCFSSHSLLLLSGLLLMQAMIARVSVVCLFVECSHSGTTVTVGEEEAIAEIQKKK